MEIITDNLFLLATIAGILVFSSLIYFDYLREERIARRMSGITIRSGKRRRSLKH